MALFFVFNGQVSSLEKHSDWPSAIFILQTLVQQGHRALIAGGAVRDMILDRPANDIDIATSATPEQVEALFDKTVMVGRQFGVSRVLVDGSDIEVATFRQDGIYKDGRKPESVQFSSEEEDARRRDFTINGMFYDPQKKEIVDYIGGQQDIQDQVIRAIGKPKQRFEEDKLRILRALRFHGQLNFTIEQRTYEAIVENVTSIEQVSMERVRDEWQKLLLSTWAPKGFLVAQKTGLWNELFSDWKYQASEYERLWLKPMKDKDQAWAQWFLLHNQGSKTWIQVQASRLKLPSRLTQAIGRCQLCFDSLEILESTLAVDTALSLSGDGMELAIELYGRLNPDKVTESWQTKLGEVRSFFTKGQLPEPLIKGKDLMNVGREPGPKMAGELKSIYRLQLSENIKLKEELIKRLK